VEAEDRGNELLFRSIVARAADCRKFPDAEMQAWLRNRAVSLVGFRVDERGKLVGEISAPKVGLSADELQFLVRHLATECDRFEFQLTGEDRE
jgi:hypothetical protein